MEEKAINLFVMDSDRALRGIRTALKQQRDRLDKQSGQLVILGVACVILVVSSIKQAAKIEALEARMNGLESKNKESVE